MKKLLITLALSNVFLCTIAKTSAITLETDKQKLSYAIGVMTANTFREQKFDIDARLFTQGFDDVMKGKELLLTDTEAQEVLQQFEDQQQQAGQAALDERAKQNLQKGQEFLEKNKQENGVVTLSSGLQYKILNKGQGTPPTADDSVTVNYEGKTINGNVFDSSYERGEPATFVVNQVIKGWQEALQRMKPGATWMLYIPAELAYGDYNVPNIGPNQVLIFKVNLVSVKKNP